jgi:uncharacterized membrane protein
MQNEAGVLPALLPLPTLLFLDDSGARAGRIEMNWELIAREPLAIQIHLATVIPGFFLGTWLIFFSTKGSRYHRILGAMYMVLMTITSFAAMFIRSLSPGQLSWVHIFIPVTLFGVASAIWSIRRGDVKGHRASMLGVYFGGLIIAGGLTFLPGRLMYRLFFE